MQHFVNQQIKKRLLVNLDERISDLKFKIQICERSISCLERMSDLDYFSFLSGISGTYCSSRNDELIKEDARLYEMKCSLRSIIEIKSIIEL